MLRKLKLQFGKLKEALRMSNGAASMPDLEAYRLEYQLAATRYENIYKAIWQIFSYLSAVAGALLAFGVSHFHRNLLWFLASFPLVFWYFSTFLPLNRYGDGCLKRLAAIEGEINRLSGASIGQYRDFRDKRSSGFWSRLRSVRLPVHILCAGLGLLFLVNGCKIILALRNNEPLVLPNLDQIKLISLTADDLKKLIQPSPPAVQTPGELKPPDHDSKGK